MLLTMPTRRVSYRERHYLVKFDAGSQPACPLHTSARSLTLTSTHTLPVRHTQDSLSTNFTSLVYQYLCGATLIEKVEQCQYLAGRGRMMQHVQALAHLVPSPGYRTLVLTPVKPNPFHPLPALRYMISPAPSLPLTCSCTSVHSMPLLIVSSSSILDPAPPATSKHVASERNKEMISFM